MGLVEIPAFAGMTGRLVGAAWFGRFGARRPCLDRTAPRHAGGRCAVAPRRAPEALQPAAKPGSGLGAARTQTGPRRDGALFGCGGEILSWVATICCGLLGPIHRDKADQHARPQSRATKVELSTGGCRWALDRPDNVHMLFRLTLAGSAAGGVTVGTERNCYGEVAAQVVTSSAWHGPKGSAARISADLSGEVKLAATITISGICRAASSINFMGGSEPGARRADLPRPPKRVA
jgi:hypothetical protein